MAVVVAFSDLKHFKQIVTLIKQKRSAGWVSLCGTLSHPQRGKAAKDSFRSLALTLPFPPRRPRDSRTLFQVRRNLSSSTNSFASSPKRLKALLASHSCSCTTQDRSTSAFSSPLPPCDSTNPVKTFAAPTEASRPLFSPGKQACTATKKLPPDWYTATQCTQRKPWHRSCRTGR